MYRYYSVIEMYEILFPVFSGLCLVEPQGLLQGTVFLPFALYLVSHVEHEKREEKQAE